MVDYYQMNRSVGAPPVVGPKRKQSRDFNAAPWIGVAVVVVVLAAALYWWFALREPAPAAAPAIEPATLTPFTEPEPEEAIEAPTVAEDSAAVDETPASPVVEDVDEPVEAASIVPEPATADVEPAASVEPGVDAGYQPTPGVPQVTVDLAFTGDCWTEVSDAGGRRLFYDLGADGRVVTLSGDAPLRLILGDADNVAVTVDGTPYTIPAAARRGRLARLSINPR